jgi:hypothetical protein
LRGRATAYSSIVHLHTVLVEYPKQLHRLEINCDTQVLWDKKTTGCIPRCQKPVYGAPQHRRGLNELAIAQIDVYVAGRKVGFARVFRG